MKRLFTLDTLQAIQAKRCARQALTRRERTITRIAGRHFPWEWRLADFVCGNQESRNGGAR